MLKLNQKLLKLFQEIYPLAPGQEKNIYCAPMRLIANKKIQPLARLEFRGPETVKRKLD